MQIVLSKMAEKPSHDDVLKAFRLFNVEGKRTIVNEMALGIEPTFLRETSRADLAVFLAVLTEMFWSRGRRNIHMSKDLSTGQLAMGADARGH